MSANTCPFCSHTIPPETSQWGGSCPSCLASIPGEETATDPGLDLLMAAEAKRARRANRRVLVATLVSSSVLCLGIIPLGAALFLGGPNVDDSRVDLGDDTLTPFDYDWATDTESIQAELAEAESDDRDTGAPDTVKQAVAVPWAVGDVGDVNVDVDGAVAKDAEAPAAGPKHRDSQALEDATIEGIGDLGSAEGGSLDLELDLFADRRAELDRQRREDAALARMSISDRLARGSTFDKIAGRCLAKAPASGAFTATFEVDVDGRVRDVVVEANGGEPNARMERCLSDAMRGYKTGAKLQEAAAGRYDFWF